MRADGEQIASVDLHFGQIGVVIEQGEEKYWNFDGSNDYGFYAVH